jgi:hypothetical protein
MHFILLGHPDSTVLHVPYIREGNPIAYNCALITKKMFPHTDPQNPANMHAQFADTLSYCTDCLKMVTSSLQPGIK